ncbi:MAG: chaperone NapD [Burkholderiaceae bacterium]
MNLSGILVVAAPGRLDDVLAALQTLEGVEVHHTDAATGRVVVVQEASSIDAEADGFTRIKSLPGVIDAALVYHRLDDAAPPADT